MSHGRRIAVVKRHLAGGGSAASSTLFEGSVAVITGAGRGIGREAAVLFAQNGARLVLNDLDRSVCDSICDEIRGLGGEAVGVPGDLTKPGVIQELVDAAIREFSGIDILVNNAGYTWDGVIHKTTDQQWQAMMDIHCTVPFKLIQAAGTHMRATAKAEIKKCGKAKPRVILNISSTTGVHGNAGQANYATAKSGIIGLTKTVAKEWGQFNIRCNAIAFGFIKTRLTGDSASGEAIKVGDEKVKLGIPGSISSHFTMMVPLGRFGEPEEAAGTILMLASPFCTYVNGHVLEVAGGAFV